jgi:hypothetical protein
MQFGKIQGIALGILGIILLGLQAMYYLTPPAATIAIVLQRSDTARRTPPLDPRNHPSKNSSVGFLLTITASCPNLVLRMTARRTSP